MTQEEINKYFEKNANEDSLNMLEFTDMLYSTSDDQIFRNIENANAYAKLHKLKNKTIKSWNYKRGIKSQENDILTVHINNSSYAVPVFSDISQGEIEEKITEHAEKVKLVLGSLKDAGVNNLQVEVIIKLSDFNIDTAKLNVHVILKKNDECFRTISDEQEIKVASFDSEEYLESFKVPVVNSFRTVLGKHMNII